MKIEERLHDAMHEYADTIDPEPGSWTRISTRFDDPLPPAPRPSRRPLVLAGVALALIVVLITTLVVRDDEEGRVVTDPSPAGAMPSRILAVEPTNGQPEILDSVTGESEQQFALGGIAAGTQVAVRPSGRDSFVVLGDGNEGCADHRIQPWPLVASTEYADPIEDATSPTVSLDGRYLAYLHCLPGDARADEIVLRDLATGDERVTTAPVGTFFINRLEFAADSRHVLYQLFDDSQGRDTLFELDLVGGGAAPGREVGQGGWVGVRGQTGQYLGMNGLDSTVTSMQPSPPFATAPLFTLREPATQVVSDRSGRHLLALVGHDLYRWSVGDEEPTKLPGEYIAAAWIPDPPAPPDGVREAVAVLDANRVVMLDATTGSVRRELFRHDAITDVTPTSDGSAVYVTTNDPGPCEGGPETFRVPTGGGEPEKLIGGVTSLRETVFGGRSIVAYTGAIDCSDAGRVIRYGSAPQPGEPIDGGPPEVRLGEDVTDVRILDWSTDGRAMVVRVERPSGIGIEKIDVASGTATPAPATEWVAAASFIVGGGENEFLTTVRQDEQGAHLDLAISSADARLGVASTGPVIDGIVRSIDVGSAEEPDECCRGLVVTEDGRLFALTGPATGLVASEIDVPGRVTAIAWLPAVTTAPDPPSPAPAPAPAATGMPENIVAGIDGRLAVLGAQDGQVKSALNAYQGLSSVSSRVDASVGAYSVFLTATGRNSACSDGPGPDARMLTVITDPVRGPQQFRTLEARRFVGGAHTPVISPDGKVVAYGIGCDGPALGVTQLKPTENVRVEPFVDERAESEPVDTVEVLGWAPDSTLLLYRVWFKGDASPRYYGGQFRRAVPRSAMDVHDIQAAPDVVAATFIDNENLALATNTARDGVSIVKGFPLSSVVASGIPGSVPITPTLFEVPGLVTSLVADPSGNHFLAKNDDGALYRWSTGDSAPTKLAEGVTAAAWLDAGVAPESSVRFGADAAIPRDFPSAVPLPDAGPLRAVVSEKNPPNASYTMTYGLDGLDAFAVGDEYRERLERAGFEIQKWNQVASSDRKTMQFEAIGKRWDVAVVSGNASPRDRSTISVQVHTYGSAASVVGGIGDTRGDLTTPTG